MNSKDSRSSSYAWKSNLHERDIIKRGSRWWIRNNRSVKIWKYNWLPIKHLPLIQSPMVESLDEATVDVLIDGGTQQWNYGLIDGFFAAQEVDVLRKIPLARTTYEDALYWPLYLHDKYTCKTGYSFLKEEEASPP